MQILAVVSDTVHSTRYIYKLYFI